MPIVLMVVPVMTSSVVVPAAISCWVRMAWIGWPEKVATTSQAEEREVAARSAPEEAIRGGKVEQLKAAGFTLGVGVARDGTSLRWLNIPHTPAHSPFREDDVFSGPQPCVVRRSHGLNL